MTFDFADIVIDIDRLDPATWKVVATPGPRLARTLREQHAARLAKARGTRGEPSEDGNGTPKPDGKRKKERR